MKNQLKINVEMAMRGYEESIPRSQLRARRREDENAVRW